MADDARGQREVDTEESGGDPLSTVAPVQATLSVLIVGEDRHSREGLAETLRREGHAVDSAADLWQAISKLRTQSFGVAIIDLDFAPLHGVSLGGWDVVRIVRAYQPGIRLIVVGAEHDARLQHHASALRIAEFLEKPISPAHLKALVRALRA